MAGPSSYWITLGTDFGIHDTQDTSVHVGPVLLKDTDRLEFKAAKLNKRKHLGRPEMDCTGRQVLLCFPCAATPMEEAKVWKLKDSPVIAFRGKRRGKQLHALCRTEGIRCAKPLNVGLEHIVDFGFFSIIAVPLFWVLKLFYQLTANYGWAIVLLTIVTRIPFIPLINKSQKSMRKMQDIQPKMAEVREKYKKDPQKMQKEMMALYKTIK